MTERVLEFLKEAHGYISGEEISQQLNISRAAIWKYMQELRAQGYEIAAVPHLGYQLMASPDKLIPGEIQFNLNTSILGQRIVSLEAATSTMDEAFRLGMDGAPEGTVVCAESQSKGRGRMGRAWVSPKGKGIYCSIILRPPLPPSQLSQLTLMTAVALSDAIERSAGLSPRIKWPNDILINDQKVAGILTELRAEVDQVKFIVIGIGLNVNSASHQLIQGATSLKMASGGSLSRVQVFQEVLRCLEEWYGKLLQNGFNHVMDAWKERSSTLKRRVKVSDPSGVIEGEALDLDIDGALLIRKDNGVVVRKTAGDVVPLR